jgi:hypothetical protein
MVYALRAKRRKRQSAFKPWGWPPAGSHSTAPVSWPGEPRRKAPGINARKEDFLAERTIVYWRDIPAQVIVRAGRRAAAKRELSERFIQAIDACAMRVGAKDTDAYLAEWRRGPAEPCGEDLEAEAETARARLEDEYGRDRLRQLVDNGGWQGQ